MIRRELKLEGPGGIQSRPAAMLVQEACKYLSRILIEQGGKTVNAKSMMGVLSLGLPAQDTLTLVVDGVDEAQAADALAPLVLMMFG